MDHFEYRQGRLYAEAVPVTDIAAAVGTPCYIYSRATIERHWRAFDHAFADHPHLVCYAVKANSNLAVLNLLARLGSAARVVARELPVLSVDLVRLLEYPGVLRRTDVDQGLVAEALITLVDACLDDFVEARARKGVMA